MKDAAGAARRGAGSRFCRASAMTGARKRALHARQNWGNRASFSRPDRHGTMGGIKRETVCVTVDVSWTRESPARRVPGGGRRRLRSVAVGLAAAGPDQAEGLAVFVVEEVGVDR